jgi:hypothetical protein
MSGSGRAAHSGHAIPTSLNAAALRDCDGRVTGVIGILRDMREQLDPK